ncbi:MAG: succinylglutamate desuccinylase/aspartoacylase family protein, partial [Magnetococcales bacterium]|nr:succinylglutamate desuccinylase/aspartoacylase family protein [Magnetococcales bacterium]
VAAVIFHPIEVSLIMDKTKLTKLFQQTCALPILLLHGNETTGLLALQQLMTRFRNKMLPRSMSVLIGNVEAARHQLRRLDGQPDYNRIWCGEGGDEFAMAQEVLQEMTNRSVFAAVDVHNNSAPNPHYAMIPRLDPPCIAMGGMFSDKLVFFLQPGASISTAFSDICPAITIECGVSGDPQQTEITARLLENLLHLDALPRESAPMDGLSFFQITAMLKVPPHLSFGFVAHESPELLFLLDPPRHNFQDMPQGTVFARCRMDHHRPTVRFTAIDENGQDLFTRFFSIQGSEIITSQSFVPAMLTLNRTIIRQDCLGYVLERIKHFPLPGIQMIDRRGAAPEGETL